MIWKWLYPGLKVKRWMVIALSGAILMGSGLTEVIDGDQSQGLAFVLTGLVILLVGFSQIIQSLARLLLPENQQKVVEILYQKTWLSRGPKLVAAGGGTGQAALLRGLKELTSNLTAIVAVTDDGGSSGRLRGELGILPPGDIRNCLVALADTEHLMEDLFNYRFGHGASLAGHNLGNLLIAAMNEMAGDFEQAIKTMSKVLAIRGQVLPSTLTDVVLVAELENGEFVEGETKISATDTRIKRMSLKPADCRPVADAILAIQEAEAIILGPGSLYTSVVPHLLVSGLAEAIRTSPAAKIYVCNVMTQPGETDSYTAADHLRALVDHGGPGLVDYILVNGKQASRETLRKYRKEGAIPVKVERREIEKLGARVVTADLIDESNLIRHDPEKLARTLLRIVVNHRNRQRRWRLGDWRPFFRLGRATKG